MVKVDTFIPKSIEYIKRECTGRAIIALSGGVDSSVCAVLAYRAIGDNLIPIYIDTGLMRKGETERIKNTFLDMNLQIIDAKDRFFAALKGVDDPEEKGRQLVKPLSGFLKRRQRNWMLILLFRVLSILTELNQKEVLSHIIMLEACPRGSASSLLWSP